MSDTPRMQSALLDHPDAGFAKIWQVGCDIERELNAANDRIKMLEEVAEDLVEQSDIYDRRRIWNITKEPKP